MMSVPEAVPIHIERFPFLNERKLKMKWKKRNEMSWDAVESRLR